MFVLLTRATVYLFSLEILSPDSLLYQLTKISA